jgi:integrase
MFQHFCGGQCGGDMASKKLTAQYLNSSLDAGRYYDDSGTGLHLYVRKSGSKSWSQKIRFGGRQLELGLGSYPAVSLSEARRIAAENKSLVARGLNPKIEREKPSIIPTFKEIAEIVIPIKCAELTNEKHKAQWRSTLEQYAYPVIGSIPVNEITVDHIHDLLKPLWIEKTETASRLRGRIQVVLNYAIVKKMMPAPNPAVWEGNLSALLPSKSKTTKPDNQPALKLVDAQRWWSELKQRDGMGSLALRFLTLTAARSGEVRGMRWDEVVLFEDSGSKAKGYAGLWTIPASRMKANREHRVPLTDEMVGVLKATGETFGLVFKSGKGTPLSDMTLSALMKRMHESEENGYLDATNGRPAVPHGLRSTFRDWVAETGQSSEAAELQLAHKFGSAVEHAYYRTDLLTERAKLLRSWWSFLEGNDD